MNWSDEYRRNLGMEPDAITIDVELPEIVAIDVPSIRAEDRHRFPWWMAAGVMVGMIIWWWVQ